MHKFHLSDLFRVSIFSLKWSRVSFPASADRSDRSLGEMCLRLVPLVGVDGG